MAVLIELELFNPLDSSGGLNCPTGCWIFLAFGKNSVCIVDSPKVAMSLNTLLRLIRLFLQTLIGVESIKEILFWHYY